MNDYLEIPSGGTTAMSRSEMLAYVTQEAPDKINHFRKSYSGSLRSAITAMCLSCRDFTANDIRECNREACPLWEQRPYKEVRARNPEKAKSDSDKAEEQNAKQTEVV
ncbi:MAG: hypothetical protein JEZ10_06305 [Verrucomicrobia bacterium]|nr:hypothetical protein [Verrucomicrobiota bacterium]